MDMPKKLEYKKTLGILGKYLARNDISIASLTKQSRLAPRTVWLAVHGYTISYNSAVKIISALEKIISGNDNSSNKDSHGVTIRSLCSGKSRTDLVICE